MPEAIDHLQLLGQALLATCSTWRLLRSSFSGGIFQPLTRKQVMTQRNYIARLENDRPPIQNQRRKDKQHKSSYIHDLTFGTRLYGFLTLPRGSTAAPQRGQNIPTSFGGIYHAFDAIAISRIWDHSAGNVEAPTAGEGVSLGLCRYLPFGHLDFWGRG